jgi:Holliday junction resolvase RusA-like endonuclease
VAGAPPYKTPEQEAQERAVGLMLRTRGYPRPLENWVAVVMLFFRPTKHRVDVDNLAKLVMDAANGIAYADDSQVRAIVAEMEIDKDDPRTVVVVAPHLANYHSGRLIG